MDDDFSPDGHGPVEDDPARHPNNSPKADSPAAAPSHLSGHSDRLKKDVINSELEYLKARRAAAEWPMETPTAGLALSGGGIRSASFNLGFVQALMEHDKFREFDYLSTVSGGGYLGGFLGAQLALSREDAAREKPLKPQLAPGENLPGDRNGEPQPGASNDHGYQKYVLPEKSGKQPAAVKRLLRSGRYLKRVPHFVNRYMFGIATVNLWIFFGLAALGAITAAAFRLVDYRPAIHIAAALGFPGDIPRAFMPAFYCALLWLGLWGFRYARQQAKHTQFTPVCDAVTRLLAIAILVLTALGFVSVLVTQDVNVPVWSIADEASPKINNTFHTLAVTLLVVQLLALIPALRLDKVVLSGARPRSRTDSVIFNIVGPAVLFGIPLLSFGWFAREDVSGVIKDKMADSFTSPVTGDAQHSDALTFAHFRNWAEFWTLVRQRAESGRTLDAKLVEAALLEAANEDVEWDSEIGREENETDLAATIRIEREYQEQMAKLPLLAGFYRFPKVLDLAQRRDKGQRVLANRLNVVLENPELLDGFQPQDLGNPTASEKRIVALAERARGLAGRANRDEAWESEVRHVNRQALQEYFGNGLLSPPGTIFALTTWKPDQIYRLTWFGIFFTAWLLLGFALSPNFGSLQEFYRERLQYMWLPARRIQRTGEERMLLSALRQPATGPHHSFPYLLINATAHTFRGDLGTLFGAEPDRLPRQQRFEFAPGYCGYARLESGDASPKQMYQPTEDFERQLYLDLPGIMAISGSAVSPAMTENFMLKTLLFLSNMRLGQWVRQPCWLDRMPKYPRLLPCLMQIFGKERETPPFLFLSDGGHYDNLGLEALLDRRVKKIICVDAGQDPDGRFIDLLKAVRRSRFLDGVRITTIGCGELGFSELERIKGCLATAHFFKAQINYPEGPPGELTYVKPSFNQDEPAELLNYRDENPDFPHDPTLDQFYDERRFESYRALGWHIAETVLGVFQATSNADWILSPLPAGATNDERQGWFMAFKERLADRLSHRRPFSQVEREKLQRLIQNYRANGKGDSWEDAVFFDCFTDMVGENVEVSETAINQAFRDGRLRECARSFVRWRAGRR